MNEEKVYIPCSGIQWKGLLSIHGALSFKRGVTLATSIPNKVLNSEFRVRRFKIKGAELPTRYSER